MKKQKTEKTSTKRIGHIQSCKSCNRGKVSFYLFTGLDSDYKPSKRELKLGGMILGSCNHCGMCCGEKQ